MNKLIFKYYSSKSHDLVGYGFAITIFGLLVDWAVELLANEMFRLALI